MGVCPRMTVLRFVHHLLLKRRLLTAANGKHNFKVTQKQINISRLFLFLSLYLLFVLDIVF